MTTASAKSLIEEWKNIILDGWNVPTGYFPFMIEKATTMMAAMLVIAQQFLDSTVHQQTVPI